MADIYAYTSNNIHCNYTMSIARSGTTVTLTVSGTIYGNGSSSDTTSGQALYVQVRTGVSPTNTSGTTTYVSSYGTLLSWTSTTSVTGYTGTNSNCMIASNTTSNNLPPLNATGFPTSGRAFTITYTTTNGAAVSLDDVALFIFKSKTSTSAPSNGAYTFIGKKSSSLSGNKIRYVTQDLSVAAATYTISYNKGSNGTGTNTTDTKTHGTALTLKGAIFTRSGYQQSGWATSDGGAQAYALSASYTANAAATLYPVWTAYKVTIKFHVNGGTITTDTSQTTRYRVSSNIIQRSTDSGSTWSDFTQSIATGTDYLNLYNVSTFGATKGGYYITGTQAYRVNSTSGTLINQDTTSSTSTNACTIQNLTGSATLTANVSVTLYINWLPYKVTIQYHANGGTLTTGTGTTRYRFGTDSILERSTDSGATWADYTSSISQGTAYVNLVNIGGSTYDGGAKLNGHHIVAETAYRAGNASTGTLINQETTSASDTNAATIEHLTGSVTLTGNVTVILYINWTPWQLTVKYSANGGTINTGTGTTRYRVSSDIVQSSTNSGSTWADLTLTSGTQGNWNLHNLVNQTTSYDGGIVRAGYGVETGAEYNTKADGTGNDINMESGSTNAATIYRMNGNAYLKADKTITLYVNWKRKDVAKVYVNGSWQLAPLKVYLNGSWVTTTNIKVYNGSSWQEV